MALQVDYSPVGALGSLATAAGRGAGQQTLLASNMRLAELASQQLGQERAFRLQKAQADKIMAAQMRSPLASAVASQADVTRGEQREWKKQAYDRLSGMRESGTISEGQHQRALMAILTDNKTLLTQALDEPRAERSRVSAAQEIDLIRRPYQEKRRVLMSELQSVRKRADDPLMGTAEDRKHAAELQQQVTDLFEAEQTDLGQWRGQTAPPVEPPGTIETKRVLDSREQDTLRMAREMAGTDSGKIGGDQPTVVQTGPPASPAPAVPAQRVVGQAYTLPNGRQGIWRGNGWEVR